MPAGGARRDTVALHTDGAIIDVSQGEPLQHKICMHVFPKALYHSLHPAQISKPFLAYVCHKPDVPGWLKASFPQ